MFDTPKSNEFTQGSVFSCAFAENYCDCPVFGLIITARCDAAQDKVPAFSYVPIVSLESWMLRDGAEIVLDRIEASLMNDLRNILKDRGLSVDSLLSTHTPEEIYEAHFRPTEGEKKFAKQCEKFRRVITHLTETRSLTGGKNIAALKAHLKCSQDIVDTVIKELVGNRLAGYYLLRGLDMDFTSTGVDCVALLREVHHIPTVIARQITKGISAVDWKSQGSVKTLCPRFRSDDDYSLPIAILKSPRIEHLMQSFALLFSRIGVKDNIFREVKQSLSSIGLGG